jgi:hypothetical protein
MNLDPEGNFSDDELQLALIQSGLTEEGLLVASGLTETQFGLDHIAAGLSEGQQ